MMTSLFRPILAGVAASVMAGTARLAAVAQGSPQGSAFETNAQARLDAQCEGDASSLAICQQLALELKRRQTREEPVVAMDDEERIEQDSTPHLTQAEQSAAQALRCTMVPTEPPCQNH